MLRNDLKSSPDTLGNIVEGIKDGEDYEEERTRYDDAVKKFGEDRDALALGTHLPWDPWALEAQGPRATHI